MSIQFIHQTGIFHLQSVDTSYAIQLFKNKYPLHLYWGRKIHGDGFGHLLQAVNRAFSPNPDHSDKSYSLDTIPMEYPSYGHSDFRIPAFVIQQENGSTIIDPIYISHRIYKGKPALGGLPATYVEAPDEADTLEIELVDELTGLRVILCYSVFEKLNAIARSVRFINSGSRELKLLKAMSMSIDFYNADYDLLQLSGAWARERHIHKRRLAPGLQSVESRRGSSSHQQNPFIALFGENANEEAGDVYGFSLVYSGNFSAGVEVDQFDSARAFMGINPFEFCWILKTGEAFQTPEAVMVYSSGGLGGMSRTYHRLYRTRLCRGAYRDADRPVLINNWEATYFDYNAEKIISLASTAKEMGIELMALDDGWFGKRDDDTSSLGDWFVDKRKLPEGLANLAGSIIKLGMQFGLWFEPEMVSPDSELYRRHPDWCIQVPERAASESRNQLVLDFSRGEVRDAVIRMISAILESVPIAYIKWDCNRHLTEIGSVSLSAKRQKETAHRYILGLYKVMEEITSKFPHILFESCSGGGGRFDPGMLYYMPQTWTSDDTDVVERLKIQYGTSIVYPVSTICSHVSAVPNHQVHRTTSFATRGNAAMFGNFGYELDITRLKQDEIELIKKQVLQYREFAELMRSGDLYRLKSPFEGNETAWMFVSEDQKDAFVTYVRVLAKPNEPLKRIFPKGLNQDFDYAIDGESDLFGGDLLMYAGLNIPFMEGDFQSCTWRLRAMNR